MIADLKSQVEQQKRVIEDALMTAETHAQRMESLEEELVSLKQVNGSLMEDNESYQMLLHEKTMTGEFLKVNDPGFILFFSHRPPQPSSIYCAMQ